MPPERNQVQDGDFKQQMGNQPHCLAVSPSWATTATQAAPKHRWLHRFSDSLQGFEELPSEETKHLEKYPQETEIRKDQVTKQEFVFYKHLGELEQRSLYFPGNKHFV